MNSPLYTLPKMERLTILENRAAQGLPLFTDDDSPPTMETGGSDFISFISQGATYANWQRNMIFQTKLRETE